MFSPDLKQFGENNNIRDPKGTLGLFEGQILKLVEKVKEKGLSHADKKKYIRMICLKHGNKLGLTPETAQEAAMYFFRLLYENPEEINEIWQNLYELNILLQEEQSLEWSVKITEKINRLFELNKGGKTLFWRIIHGLIRGNLDVKEIVINNESIYYIGVPDENTRKTRNTDIKRQEISASFQKDMKGMIVEKPLPEIPEIIKQFTEFDQSYLRKIFLFLQQDADLLVFSSEWKKLIQKYFDDVAGFLNSSVSNIKLEANRSNVRKVRYAEYINQILNGYLTKLLEYCLKMDDAKNENRFAADILLEPYLVNAKVLINGTDEPNISVIVRPWQKLTRDIQNIVGDSATMINIQVFQNPAKPQDDGILETEVQGLDPGEFPLRAESFPRFNKTLFFHPALSGEIPSADTPSIQAVTHDDVLKRTVIGRPAINTPVPENKSDSDRNELLDWASEPSITPPPAAAQEERGKVTRRRKPSLDGMVMGLKAFDEKSAHQAGFPDVKNPKGIDPFGATVSVNTMKQPIQPAQPVQKNPVLNYLDFFDSLKGEERKKAEEYIKGLISKEIVFLKNQILEGSLDLKSQSMTFLLNKLQSEIYFRHALSDNLRKFFISECCRLYNDINSPKNLSTRGKEPDSLTKEYVYSTLNILFGGVAQQVKIHDELFGIFRSDCGTGLPDSNNLSSFRNLPQLSDYPKLSAKLKENSPVYEEIRKFALSATDNLSNFTYYFESLAKIAEGSQDAATDFKKYFSDLREEYEQMQSMLQNLKKKLSGGFFKKLFSDKELICEINEFFTRLSNQIEWIWQAGIEPSMQMYGKIILGKHRRLTPAGRV